MPCGKSCFNVTLFRKNLTRFWPIWSLYLALWLLMPLSVLSDGWDPYTPLRTLQLGLIAAVFFGVLAAMAVFSYLYNSKSVQLMHALPIRREGLFLTNYLSGLAFLLLPNLLVSLLTLVACGFQQGYTVVLWLVGQSLMCLFFYSFAVFCAMFTGNLVALPVFYFILHFLVFGFFHIVDSLLRQFLFGYAGTPGLDDLVYWFTPILNLGQLIGWTITEKGVYILSGLPAILLYGFVGLLLAGGALLLYRRRALETAGDLVSIRPVRPFFKYGVAICAAVFLGSLLYESFRSLLPRGDWAILIPLLLCGLVGYFVAEMLLRKSFRVFRKSWVGGLCFSLALVALFFTTNWDLFQFNRLPDRATVESVRIFGPNTAPQDSGRYVDLTLTDAAQIDAAMGIHDILIRNKRAVQEEISRDSQTYESRWREEVTSDGHTLETRYYEIQSLYLTYTLTDGRILRRAYDIPLHADSIGNPDSLEGALTALLNDSAIIHQLYWVRQNLSAGAKLVEITVESSLPISLDGEAEMAELLAAIQSDMAAGNIGRRYLLDTVERYENCYYNDITLYFYGMVDLPSSVSRDGLPAAQSERRDWAITITPQSSSTETLKVLRKLGYPLITMAERQYEPTSVPG